MSAAAALCFVLGFVSMAASGVSRTVPRQDFYLALGVCLFVVTCGLVIAGGVS